MPMYWLNLRTKTEMYNIGLGLLRQVTLSKDHLSIKTTLLWPIGGRFRQVPLYLSYLE